ncbi:MAG: ABC transporter ATP-binding protein [Verrucomicrobia bacterium]|nr:ABC transporter ATP-binding protein [Verrucomicrobiota bacterium]MCH8528297.1 ABC transporter ATP-binding protein/permease [Kiritimatiellia bacterium]
MRGPMSTVGGIPRTFGLQRAFGKEEPTPGQRINRASFRRIAAYFKPYWGKGLVVVVCILLSSGLSVLPPFCVAGIVDVALPEQREGLLIALAGAMVGLAVLSGLIGVLQQSLTARVGQGIMYDIRQQLYRHLQSMSLNFFMTNRSGEIISRINNDVSAVQGVATGTFVSILSNLATLIATSAALLSMNWRLTLLAVVVVPAFYIPSKVVGKIRRRLSAETQDRHAALLGFMGERLHMAGAMLMHIFGQRDADAEIFSRHSSEVRDLHVRQTVVGRWLFVILSVFSALGPALIFWYGGMQVMEGSLSVGQLIAFAALLTLLYRPLMQLATVYVDIQGSFAVFDRIFEYLDMVPDVRNAPETQPLPSTRGHVVFEKVGFEYPAAAPAGRELPEADAAETPAPRPALVDVSFEIAPGQRVALVGLSGAGKSTITYMLPRFYDPNEGRITLDGIDLRELDQAELRQHIGMVTQETFLFHDTLRTNLLYARPDADEAKMIEACRAANIHDFIAGLPDGYDTLVGERGFRLSGGEKQRVSIARALLKDPAILILDEATSNLDATSEYLIQGALETLLRGRTSLVIAHRLSTILSADQILVMDSGRIVDRGRHEELIAREGLYSTLFEQQFHHVLNSQK